jgi:glucosyl-3-phosphoglycerate synthase
MSDTIEKWLETNTFHHGEFWDILELVKEKEEKGLKISLCIPTLNEEKTIGKEIVIFRSELMERYPLIDEFAVIDSGSEDNTCDVAASFGADVYRAADILPEVGDKRGKGENLWKAIYQLKGDIIVYVDADIKNIHPRFVTGIVAPLIKNDTIKYCKAFYDRPMAFSSGIRSSGGGRVTEILIRPLFSLFFPELTALIQPSRSVTGSKRHTFWMCIKNGASKPSLSATWTNAFIETKAPMRWERCRLVSCRPS